MNIERIEPAEYPIIKWFNWYLGKKDSANDVNCLSDLRDGKLIIDVLSETLGRPLVSNGKSVERNWAAILDRCGSDVESLFKPENRSVSDRPFVELLWRVILSYQLCKQSKHLKMYDNYQPEDSQSLLEESDKLLKWVNRKIQKNRITNWNSDWMDGKVLCHLINAVRPGCIPDSDVYENAREIRIRTACTRAENELGVPDLILPKELSNGQCKKEVLITYVAFLRDIDRALKNPEIPNLDNLEKPVDFTGIPFRPSLCLAFGSGLRWGQVGKAAEFVLQLQKNINLSDILVSIECRPYDYRSPRFRPQLEIKPIESKCYLVRYTPTRPGRYFIGVLCSNKHISNSPYQISIKETVIGHNLVPNLLGRELEELLNLENDEKEDLKDYDFNNNIDEILSEIEKDEKQFLSSRQEGFTKSGEFSTSYDSRHDSAFIDDDDLHSPSLSSGEFPASTLLDHDTVEETFEDEIQLKNIKVSNFKIFGRGLHTGEVGRISTFTVQTPTYIDQTGMAQGPLCVSITCPAVSIPVPFVRTKFLSTMLEHQVIYIPTEPGVYEITVKWGDDVICGSPFSLSVSDTIPTFPALEIEEKTHIPVFRDTGRSDLLLYYSATTDDESQYQRKSVLEQLLRKHSPDHVVFPIPVDIVLDGKQRQILFEQVNGRKLPFVFMNNKLLGDYQELMSLHHKHGMHIFLDSVRSKLEKVNSKWSNVNTKV